MDGNDALNIVTCRLQPGDRLIWHGVPTPWRAAIPYLFPLAFITVWTGFAFFMVSQVAGRGSIIDAQQNFPASTIPVLFCILGCAIWFWIFRRIADCWRTAYALTDRRMIIAAGKNGSTKSLAPLALSDLVRKGDATSGTLLFGHQTFNRPFGYGSYDIGRGFFGIRDPARVEALIYETLLNPNK